MILQIVVRSIPDGGDLRHLVRERRHGVGLIVTLAIASGVLFNVLNLPRRAAFAIAIFLLLVFVAAQVQGMLVSWVTLAIATLTLCLILPPVHPLRVARPQDQILLVFFILCGPVGARMITQNQRA